MLSTKDTPHGNPIKTTTLLEEALRESPMDWTSVELPGLVRKRGKNFRWFARPRWGKQRGSVVSPRRMWRYCLYGSLRATYIINFIISAGKSRHEGDIFVILISVVAL